MMIDDAGIARVAKLIGGLLVAGSVLVAGVVNAASGRVIISGHDSDFHALAGNTAGAINIINRTLDYVRFGNTAPILFIKSNEDNLALGDHLDSELGLQAAGYSLGSGPGNNYVRVNATDFATTVLSPTAYSAIFVPSDHGGTLTNADLTALNARAGDILGYLQAGGGLVAFAQDGFRSGGSSAANFGFVPGTVVSATPLTTEETNITLTAFGESMIGLTNADVNGNFYHNYFVSWSLPATAIDLDNSGNLLTLAAAVTLVPEPQTYALFAAGLGIVAWSVRSRRRSRG